MVVFVLVLGLIPQLLCACLFSHLLQSLFVIVPCMACLWSVIVAFPGYIHNSLILTTNHFLKISMQRSILNELIRKIKLKLQKNEKYDSAYHCISP